MVEHLFQGDAETCARCSEPRDRHRAARGRVYHVPDGEPCSCGKPKGQHASQKTLDARKAYNAARDQSKNAPPKPARVAARTPRVPKPRVPRIHKERAIIGIDGEGHDLPDGRHIYTLLCAVDATGRVVNEAYNPEGLSPGECFRMLASLPEDALKFVFMGSYDWTKMVEGLHPLDVYKIMRPEVRRRRICTACKHRWRPLDPKELLCPECSSEKTRSVMPLYPVAADKQGRALNIGLDWFNGSFTVATSSPPRPGKKERWDRKIKVWDCFKFFQTSFLNAIKLWKIGTPEQHARIGEMKAKRGAFDKEDPADVRRYCLEECELLACMMRKVLAACSEAGIELKSRFDGAGAIASALLKKYEVKECLGPDLETFPTGLQHAVMSAYFGGRFENSVVGAVEDPVFNRDIFSAYPYALSGLPCLACGEWTRVIKRVLASARKGTLAVVRFKVGKLTPAQREKMAWLPLPFRDARGSICYPSGFEGWAWLPELEQALKGWPELISVCEAWVYTTTCDHAPFAWIPDTYRKRMQWGKDGPGIVLKLGLNACAGKTMQQAGDKPPWKSWVLGGMITATTRAQALEAIIAAKDRWSVLAIATDGVFATEKIELPPSRDTGTFDLEKPLGQWGCELHEHGVFFVKPGLYFDNENLMRARGIGRSELARINTDIRVAFRTWDRRGDCLVTANSRRFYGARSSVQVYSECRHCVQVLAGVGLCPTCGKARAVRASLQMLHRDGKRTLIPALGRWAERPIEIEFQSLPKRERISLGGSFGRMRVRDVGGAVSLPYLGVTTPEGLAAREATAEGLEQPDWADEAL